MSDTHLKQRFSTQEKGLSTSSSGYQKYFSKWRSDSWSYVENQALKTASALLAQGYQKGDRIAILAKRSVEWLIADVAITMTGMISMPIYATSLEDTIAYVLENGKCKAIFIGELNDYTPIRRAMLSVNSGIPVIGFPYANINWDFYWTGLLYTFEVADDQLW